RKTTRPAWTCKLSASCPGVARAIGGDHHAALFPPSNRVTAPARPGAPPRRPAAEARAERSGRTAPPVLAPRGRGGRAHRGPGDRRGDRPQAREPTAQPEGEGPRSTGGPTVCPRPPAARHERRVRQHACRGGPVGGPRRQAPLPAARLGPLRGP